MHKADDPKRRFSHALRDQGLVGLLSAFPKKRPFFCQVCGWISLALCFVATYAYLPLYFGIWGYIFVALFLLSIIGRFLANLEVRKKERRISYELGLADEHFYYFEDPDSLNKWQREALFKKIGPDPVADHDRYRCWREGILGGRNMQAVETEEFYRGFTDIDDIFKH